MYFADDVIEEVRARNDIVDVISGYVRLQKKGNAYVGLCPFHNEKTPSFSVSRERQLYHCFGCGAGGSVFTFVMQHDHQTFPEAVRTLADRAGIPLPEGQFDAKEKERQGKKSKILELNKEAATYYFYQLRAQAGAYAMQYLKGRGLSDETIRQFGLGYAPKSRDGLYRYLKTKQASDALLAEAGLVSQDGARGMSDKFWNRVMFPIMDVNRRVIGFGGRVMGEGKPKYLNSPETAVFDKGRHLYGLHLARLSKKKNLLLCEGYMDVITLHQAGFSNAVASLGTSLTAAHAALLRHYTEEVLLVYDSDDAGVRATLRAIPILAEAGVTARVADLSPYKDPDEFLQNQGSEALQERLDQAKNSFLFETDLMQGARDMQDPAEKTAFYEELADKLVGFSDDLARETYLEAAARRYGVDAGGLRKLVKKRALLAPAAHRSPVEKPPRAKKEPGICKSMKLVLTWLIEYPGLFGDVKKYVSPDDFAGEPYHTVATLLFDQYERGERAPAKILDHFADTDAQSAVSAMFHSDTDIAAGQDREKALRESLQRIAQHSLDEKREALSPDDMEGMQALLDAQKAVRKIGQATFRFS